MSQSGCSACGALPSASVSTRTPSSIRDGRRFPDVDARAKALRLQQRVACQLHAGDASRKAQIVFDRELVPACRRWRGAEHEDVQSLGGAVDRRGPRRPGADDDGRALRRDRGGVETGTPGEIFDGRAPEKRPSRPTTTSVSEAESELTKQPSAWRLLSRSIHGTESHSGSRNRAGDAHRSRSAIRRSSGLRSRRSATASGAGKALRTLTSSGHSSTAWRSASALSSEHPVLSHPRGHDARTPGSRSTSPVNCCAHGRR